MSAVSLVPLAAVDPHAIELLLDRAFGDDRRARTAYRLREGTTAIAALSFAAISGDGTLVGSIQCWPVALVTGAGRLPLVMVGPIAVAPERQGTGIGKALVKRTLAIADAAGASIPGADRLMMIGDPDYYGRFFGFTAEATAGWEVPGPVERHRLLARAWAGGSPAIWGQVEPDPAATRV